MNQNYVSVKKKIHLNLTNSNIRNKVLFKQFLIIFTQDPYNEPDD